LSSDGHVSREGETLEHLVVNPLAVFRKIRRILRPGGSLLITLPNALRLTNFALMLDGRSAQLSPAMLARRAAP
jgi:SAM-dependent methyltransferase